MDELDMDELARVFLEECAENVDVLERGLLQIGDGSKEPDLLNDVFRAAHSIKGGGATFGFIHLSELTHYMETLLDEMRSGKRAIGDADLELLLTSVDIVRDMMDAGGQTDHPDREDMQNKLSSVVGEEGAKGATTAENSDAAAQPQAAQTWSIRFAPKPEIMTRGNDPLLLIREVHRLGDLDITMGLEALPDWDELDPKSCYLPWEGQLTGEMGKEAITEIFEWVEFDCDLEVTQENSEPQLPIATEVSDSVSVDAEPGAEPGAEPVEPTENIETVAAQKTEQTSSAKPSAESASIRISTDKIDQMINLVGELVITQSMLSRLGEDDDVPDADELRDRLSQLERNTRELQESVMRVRMMPMSSGFNRLPRLVRDLSRKLNKQVDLVVEGGSTEIDKTVLERMMDPLVHLVRNALDHGLENPEERTTAGKPATGKLLLSAYHQGGSVIIEIIDDGRGIDRDRVLQLAIERGVTAENDVLTDEQIYQLIFEPGFSTAKEVSDVSGRGVGMDVVRKNILDLGGRVELDSDAGKGTTVKIRLPLTLAILDGQLIRAAGQDFVIPLLSIIETIEIGDSKAASLPNSGNVCRFRGEYVPLIHLAKRLRLAGDSPGNLVVIVEAHGHLLGIVIDKVLGQQQVVIKALEDNYRAVPGITGATIMSDGSVALILDPPSLRADNKLSDVA